MKRFVGNDLEFVPALYEERVEYQYHDRFDQEVEEDQQEGIHLCGDTYGEAGHSSKNEIGGRNTQKGLYLPGEKEGTQQEQQHKKPQKSQSGEQYPPFDMSEK